MTRQGKPLTITRLPTEYEMSHVERQFGCITAAVIFIAGFLVGWVASGVRY